MGINDKVSSHDGSLSWLETIPITSTKKILFTSGCSYCTGWPEILAKKLNRKLINMGHGGAGNEIINTNTIYVVKKILDSGVAPKNILPVVSWGEVNRKDLVINTVDTVEYESLVEGKYKNANVSRCFFQGNNYDDKKYTNGKQSYWIKSGGQFADSYWKNYYKYYFTTEQHFLNTLNIIYYTQLFFEKYGIDYKMVVWQNIFHYCDIRDMAGGHEKYIGHFKSKNAELWCDYYPSTKHIWDMIDFSKFIFYEDADVSMGGIAEHNVKNNIPLESNHPAFKGNIKYVDDVLLPVLGGSSNE